MNNNKIIPFQPDGDFYFNTGMKKLDQNKKREALDAFAKAYHMDSDNLSYIAQYVFLLAELQRGREAETIIMDKFIQHEFDAEFYFLMSQLYMVLGDANKAFLFGMMYSQHFPDEKYDEELSTMFEIDIEDDKEVMQEAELFVGQHVFQYMFMNAKIEASLEYLSGLSVKSQELKEFRNARAMALLFLNQYKEAYEILEQLLKEDQTDMHALSHMTLLYYHTDQKENYEMSLKKLEVVQPFNDEDSFKIGLVLNFLKKYDRSYELLYPLYKRKEFMSFQLLHALSHASYQIGKHDQAREFWDKMQTFYHVPEAQSPWSMDAAVEMISDIVDMYLLDDNVTRRLLGIYYLSTVHPNDAIFGHAAWDTIDKLGDYEKLYVSWIYRGITVPRLERMHEGLSVLEDTLGREDDIHEYWIAFYNDLYDYDIDMWELKPFLALTVYFFHDHLTQKDCIEMFDISRYKFNKAYDLVEPIL